MLRRFALAGLFGPIVYAQLLSAKPVVTPHEVTSSDDQVDVVGDIDGTHPVPRKALADTVWIATWTFDAGNSCTDAGWEQIDNHIKNNGAVYWYTGSGFSGMGGIDGSAAILGNQGETCCVEPNGYDNDWYQAIRLQYSGSATLGFDYLIDSEEGFDFLQVETDSACASLTRVDHYDRPRQSAASYRNLVYSDTGNELAGHVSGLTLTDHGPGNHCVCIAFFSDGGFSPCDGLQSSTLGAGLVVDNIALVDAGGTRTEDFEGVVDPGLFANIWDTQPFGEWGRLFRHITDNDLCTENTTCAWIWTDNITPTIVPNPCDGCPTQFAVRAWIDNIIVSPWVSLASTPSGSGTVIRFRRFPSDFNRSQIQSGWSVRGKKPVQNGECVSTWGHAVHFTTASTFQWITTTDDMTAFFDPQSTHIQVRHRVVDHRVRFGGGDPPVHIPGPGPYMDDTRIGRIILSGPVLDEGIDARSQAQDCFPTPGGGGGPMDRFGTCAFSAGADVGGYGTPSVVIGDSIWIDARDVRSAGGIASLEWFGAIVSGPHAGKAPAPHILGANGFFAVTPSPVLNSQGQVVEGRFFVDLDDTYFRGGDVLRSFWIAEDAFGGVTSDPPGLSGVPASVNAAEATTGGLLEVNFLPRIDWAPAYIARIVADANGDLAPTAAELAASSQRNCILYVNQVNARRRSGDLNRTSFMYSLDRLGYRGRYDVYDHSGIGNTNNHLGGRATIEQASGYALIVYDAGNAAPGRPIMPDGVDRNSEKVDQATWFRNWLAQAASAGVDHATLWILGSNAMEEKPTNPLYTADMGGVFLQSDQAVNVNPDVQGTAAFTFANSTGPVSQDFTVGPRARFRLNGGCPSIRNYDGLGASGTAARVYRYRDPSAGNLVAGALVMNSNPAANWNTILQSHPWFDISELSGSPDANPERDLLATILESVLPPACVLTENPTDAPEPPGVNTPALQTQLHQNVPNPFNPVTTIRFDLARSGHVRLVIYDVAGNLVRTLVDTDLEAGSGKAAIWNGLDEAGRSVSSGVYIYRLEAPEARSTRKMLLLH